MVAIQAMQSILLVKLSPVKEKPVKNLTLSTRLIIVQAILWLLIVVLSALTVSSNLKQLELSDRDIEIVAITEALANIAHNYAVERGLSAGFLGSKGEKFQNELRQQRLTADNNKQVLQALATTIDRLGMTALLAPLKQKLDNIAQTRRRVDQLDRSTFFNEYSELNALAIKLSQLVMSKLSRQDLRDDANQVIKLLWIKERAGQERGALNGVFAAGNLSDERKVQINEYISQQNAYAELFKSNASEAQILAYQQAIESSSLNVFYRMREDFQRQAAQSASISGISASDWFAAATARIKSIASVLNDIRGDIVAQAEKAKSQANYTLWLTALILIAVLASSITLSFYTVKSLSRGVQKIVNALNKVIQHGDLSHRINTQREDEIGQISSALDAFLDSLENIFRDVVQISERLSKNASESSDAIQMNQMAVSKQLSDSTVIATAISEMSASIADVASSANQVNQIMEATAELNTQTSQLSTSTATSVSQLNEHIQSSDGQVVELSEQVKDIEQILQSIVTITEQTNLLALNAAIEAARAGDQGRGFAVVADEVRALSARTQTSTVEIQQIIDRLSMASQAARTSMSQCIEQVQKSVEFANSSKATVQEFIEKLKQTQDLTSQIAVATEQQTSVAAEIDRNTLQIKNIAEENENGSEVIRKASEVTSRIALRLKEMTSKYKFS